VEDNLASTLVQFRIEKDEKQRSSQILETMGLSLPAYLRICMIRLNKEKGIPFSMKLDDRIPEEGTGIELPS
jgi:DNA-damage-inducible protein J